MPSLVNFIILVVITAHLGYIAAGRCDNKREHLMPFYRIHEGQRSKQAFVDLKNVFSLEACMAVARSTFGMAFNFAPFGTRQLDPELPSSNEVINFQRSRNHSRLHYWEQPEEFFNCHVLQCPENSTQRTLVNDSRFDYYSAYAYISVIDVCIPGIGIFQMHTSPATYLNASLTCMQNRNNSTAAYATLAHIMSERRTNALTKFITTYKPKNTENITRISMAYVGLHYDPAVSKTRIEFMNEEKERLSCFLFRAWAIGHPKNNSNCVALSRDRSWISVECIRKLPYICEVFTSKP